MASSVSFGALEDSADISQYNYVRGQLTTQAEMWGALKFNHRDLMEHDGKINEKSFLKILPGQIDDFVGYMKMAASINLMDGPHFARLTVDGTAGGVIEVDRIDRFSISQKLVIDDDNSSPLTVYVIAIDINAGTTTPKRGTVTLSATRGGAAVDVSAYTVAQNAKTYHVGAQAASYTSIKSQLLSAVNGGSTLLFGQTKTAFPYLQAVNIDGSGITTSNFLAKLFDAYTQRQQLAKSGKMPEFLMSYKNFGTALKQLESSKGAFNVVPESRKASQFGWQEVSIGSVSGELIKLVAIQEHDDDNIKILDWDSITLYTNGFLQRRTAPDGKQYFESRATTGYSYILDHCMFGDIVVKSPWKNAIIYGISY
jgi:hypothetical protein